MIGYEKGLLKLRGVIDSKTKLLLQIGGFLLLVLLWYVVTVGDAPFVRKAVLPAPGKVYYAFFELLQENDLIVHMMRSIGLNIAGYLEAVILAMVVGFVVGLYPLFRGLFQHQVDAIRFVPLTAVTVIFMAMFGLGVEMKIHFLAFGIFIYLLPVIVQRIDDVSDVYLKTVYTLGASNWQTIKSVYIPYVTSKAIDDIRVLTAISWTYIIFAEMQGNEGGVGSLIWRIGQRQGRMDKVYVLLLLIILIGVLQDKIFKMLDRHFFPHKYQVKKNYGSAKKDSALSALVAFVWKILFWVMLSIYFVLIINEYSGLLTDTKVLSHYFGGTTAVMNLTVLGIIFYQVYQLIENRKK